MMNKARDETCQFLSVLLFPPDGVSTKGLNLVALSPWRLWNHVCLDKTPQIPMRSILAVLTVICVLAESSIVLWILPWLSRQSSDGRVEGCEQRGVVRASFEASRYRLDVASETSEDVDVALSAEYVGYGDAAA